jgi:dihydroceramidase
LSISTFAQAAGFWGPPTSSIDWCEPNYVHTPYVAELFNSLSSFSMVIAGVAGLLWGWHRLERRFLLAYESLALVGLGSVAFHGSLRFETQMLDELPMVYLVLLMVFILLENPRQKPPRRGLQMGLMAYGAVLTFLCTFTRGPVQFATFHSSFGSLELFALVLAYFVQRRSQNLAVRRWYRAGMAMYSAGLVAWFTDLKQCEWVSHTLPFNPQFHAVWHLFVSGGFYTLLWVIAQQRLEVLGARNQAVGPVRSTAPAA